MHRKLPRGIAGICGIWLEIKTWYTSYVNEHYLATGGQKNYKSASAKRAGHKSTEKTRISCNLQYRPRKLDLYVIIRYLLRPI